MIDITRSLYPGHPTWPGDAPYEIQPTARIADGDSVNVGRLVAPLHLGTHLDAPWHYDDEGGRLEELPLELLVGEALVLHHLAGGAVGPELVAHAQRLPERVLVRTGQPERWEAFPEDFAPLTPELVHALADRGVRLVGTDAPSVDAYGGEGLPVHHACAERGLIIVEGLELTRADQGHYRLVCLPLALPHADGSPVRAVLEPLQPPAGGSEPQR